MTTITINSGVTSSGISLGSGDSLVGDAGGTAIASTVDSGGIAAINGSAIAPEVSSGGPEAIFAGEVVSGGMVIYGGGQFVSSCGVDTAMLVGGNEFVFSSGGIARGATSSPAPRPIPGVQGISRLSDFG